ncbi:hypothetical protein CIB48_g5580 [Xylaria polymorpha]|nr:hypothetical protein CIB48_g5580 [Xylaria polymorpha]
MSDTRSEDKPTKRPEGDKAVVSRPQEHATSSCPTIPGADDFGDASQSSDGDIGLKDLIQFFRKTPPPPTNLMSIPDHFSSSSEEDKWDKFKTRVFRRPSNKLRKRRPPIIMLPDSAVAARTTDGHRYIAISIPTEHSPLEPRPASRYPVYDSVEAVFHRDINSKFGMWKPSPAHRVVTVLNPVPEDLCESMSSGSALSTAFEQPDQPTALSQPSMRKRAHTVSLLPSQEQRYTPGKAKDTARSRSVSDPRSVPIPQSSKEKDAPVSETAEKSEPGPSRQDEPAAAASKDIDGAESSSTRLPERPVIVLTLPSRKSSRRGKQLEPASPEGTSPGQGSPSSTSGTNSNSNSNSNGNGNGNGNGDGSGYQRNSFAASIETTSSSPQVLKATTAIVGQSIPIVVRQAGADVESPLDLNFPEPPTKNNRAARTSAVGPSSSLTPERSKSKKERARERKQQQQQDADKLRVQTELKGKGKGKGKETASHPFGFLPSMPAVFPKMAPSTILGHRRPREERGDDSSTYHSLSSSVSSHYSDPADKVSSPTSPPPPPPPPLPLPPPPPQQREHREQREEREARYMARALTEERETLEKLPREELIQRYQVLREQRIYERERRLRKLERSRDSWVSAVPMLLQDLNGLLRQQHRILESAGFPTTQGFPPPPPAGSSQHHGHSHHLRHPRRRSHSVEASSSGSPPSDPDPLETRRPRSLHSSS